MIRDMLSGVEFYRSGEISKKIEEAKGPSRTVVYRALNELVMDKEIFKHEDGRVTKYSLWEKRDRLTIESKSNRVVRGIIKKQSERMLEELVGYTPPNDEGNRLLDRRSNYYHDLQERCILVFTSINAYEESVNRQLVNRSWGDMRPDDVQIRQWIDYFTRVIIEFEKLEKSTGLND